MQIPGRLEVRPGVFLSQYRLSHQVFLSLACLTTFLACCRDDLLTNCKEATAVSPTPWCFTVGSNKRRACTAEEGATRPLSWFFAQHQVQKHRNAAAVMPGQGWMPHRAT